MKKCQNQYATPNRLFSHSHHCFTYIHLISITNLPYVLGEGRGGSYLNYNHLFRDTFSIVYNISNWILDVQSTLMCTTKEFKTTFNETYTSKISKAVFLFSLLMFHCYYGVHPLSEFSTGRKVKSTSNTCACRIVPQTVRNRLW